MKKILAILILNFSFLIFNSVSAATPSFTNPILPYDYSDPDVCRVGDTYLMTSSSFNNVPGLQILASKDLVHWEIVDAAIRYRLPGYEEGDKLTGNFVWAPAIREHDGRIYIYYGDPDRGIYCVRSKPYTIHHTPYTINFPLEWEEPVLVIAAKGYIDPCPLWDEDGRVWLSHGVAGSRFGLKSVLLMAELNADGLSVKVPSRIIFDGHEEHPTSEGTKLYKRNGYYYLMHPAGGVPTGWQVVQRSKNIYGPYELKITLAQGKTNINGPHQGGWVETPEGEHLFIHFQDVGVAGRIVHMQPVKWVNDWPVMGNNGEPVIKYKGLTTNDKRPTYANFAHRDEFDKAELGLDWQFAGGEVRPQWFFCDAANSKLRLYSAPRTEELMPNMLLQKIPAVAFTATARVRFAPHKDKKMVGAEQAGMVVFGRKSFTLEAPVTDEWCYLRLVMDAHQKGQFYVGVESQKSKDKSDIKWTKSGEAFQAVEGHWIGAQVGLFCTRDNRKFNDSGWLDVDWFEIEL